MRSEPDESFDYSCVCTRAGHCPVCAAPNQCRLESGVSYKGPCWCERPVLLNSSLLRLLADLPEPRCLCPACLEALAHDPDVTWDELAARNTPAPPLPPREDEFYMEGECVVFTAKYHLRRGYCCGSACRHCPYASGTETESNRPIG
jgi:hypothetical protein